MVRYHPLLSSRISLFPAVPLSLSFNARHSLAIYFRDRHHIAWSISPSTVRPYVLPRPSTRSLGNPLPLPSASLPPVSLPLLCLFLLFHCHCPRMSERAGRAWEIHQIARMSKRSVPLVLVRARPSHYSRESLLASAAMVIGHCLTRSDVTTVRVDSLPHRKWREIQQQPGTAGPGNMLGCCLIYFHFLWGKLSTRTVHKSNIQWLHDVMRYLADICKNVFGCQDKVVRIQLSLGSSDIEQVKRM